MLADRELVLDVGLTDRNWPKTAATRSKQSIALARHTVVRHGRRGNGYRNSCCLASGETLYGIDRSELTV